MSKKEFFFQNNLQIDRLKRSYIAGGVMAGSVATLAVLWIFLQTLGFIGNSHSVGVYKLPKTFQNDLPVYSNLVGFDHQLAEKIVLGNFEKRKWPKIEDNALNESIAFADRMIKFRSRFETNLINSGISLSKSTPSHSQYVYSYPSEDAFEKSNDAIIAAKASSYLVQDNCGRFGLGIRECAQFISTIKLDGTLLNNACGNNQQSHCTPNSRYRSIDGSCNNLENPKLGCAMTAYTRLLFPNYDDGIQNPRQSGLPNPRLVSSKLSTPSDQSDVLRTLVVMQWSDFILHDLAHTPVRKMISNGMPISCCKEDGNTLLPRHIHPDCSAIPIEDHDPIYSSHSIRCMNYVRSLPVIRSDCSFGPLEQMNQVSHFLDGSTIYGSTLERSERLRTFQGGLLRVDVENNREYLPTADSEPFTLCLTPKCYLSGDDRVNVEPSLAVMHTIWHREHNRIAKKLSEINPSWSDEILYQEARKIVVAEIQHITYNEWLTIILGKNYARDFGLLMDGSQNYNSNEDPAVANEVATAALQFQKSLKQSYLRIMDENQGFNKSIHLCDNYYKPEIIEKDNTFDGIIKSLTTETSQMMDVNMIPDVTHQLFKTNGELGLDAVSLDIQRGRDHGLPGYNYYRNYCGLPAVRKFDDFKQMGNKLRELYNSPDDVDLIIGGMIEKPEDEEEGILGPTFRCLIAEQFARTRRADRYFYDSASQPYPFTEDQLNNIRNVTLARIFCDNSDNISKIQRNVFLKSKSGNELRFCNDFEAIPSVDLFAWAEKAKAYR
ncbi:peroxidase-like isoform X2 [Leptopilina boulardi]|uniref:peroxidase-like isoform X2 n=1 Tax=Leptopilina boulardi TaxID=63433 RepID=UPI0021F5642A|nr:peroxidase-like isoform X2 [Leptopilina boulardi]